MNDKIIDKLVEMEVFSYKRLTEEEFKNESTNNNDPSIIYKSGSYKNSDETEMKWFRRIDTKGLSNEEIQILLALDRTENIRSIKKMIIFFVVLAVISIIISIWSGASIASML